MVYQGLMDDHLTEPAENQAMIDAVLRAIPDQPLPDLGPAVLDRIRVTRPAVAPRPRVRLVDWLWAPRSFSFQFRPAYAFAAAMLLLLGVQTLILRDGGGAQVPTQQVLVQFRLDAPQARAVSLAGEFTKWKPDVVLKRTAPGVWTVVVPLTPGVHDYAFIVDGERWVPDPMAPAIEDGFGGLNSRMAVLAPDAVEAL
jgi:hypothetical protein